MINRILAVLSLTTMILATGDRLSVVGALGPQTRPTLQKGDPRTSPRRPDRTANRLRKAAAGPRTTWVRTYSREGTLSLSGVGVIYGFRMAPASDGGYFLLGHTSVDIPASYDSCVVKVDAAGSIVWQRVFREGAGAGNTQFLLSISATSDGGCVAGGRSASGVLSMKFEADGDVAWQRSFDREGAREEFADLRQTSDGGLLLLASSGLEDGTGVVADRDILLIKLGPLGDPVWQKTYGGPFEESARRFVEMPEGGFAVLGSTPTEPDGSGTSPLVLRLGATGEVVWQAVCPADAYPFSMAVTPDGGLIVAGSMNDATTVHSLDAWAMKLAPEGGVEWTRAYHGKRDDHFSAITAMPDGAFLAAGSSLSFSYDGERALLAKLSTGGDIEWQRIYGPSGPGEGGSSYITSIFPSSEGWIALGGTTSFGGMGGIRFMLMKTSTDGLVARLPGFVTDAGLEVRALAVEALPAALVLEDVPVVSSVPELTSLDVAIRGGLLFAPPLNAAVARTASRSLALRGLSNLLTWEPNPVNDDVEIAKYRIYAVGPIPPPDWFGDLVILPDDAFHLFEVDGDVYRSGQSPLLPGGYEYMIWGVGADGTEGLAVRLIQLAEGQQP